MYMDIYSKIHNKIETPLSRQFFSKDNMLHIQCSLIKQVKHETGVVISKQPDSEILTLMTNAMNSYGEFNHESNKQRYIPTEIPENLFILNSQVIRGATDTIKKGILHYTQYIKDASSLPVPIPRGVMSTEETTFEMNKRFF